MTERIVELDKVVGGGYKDFWKARNRYRWSIGGRNSKKSTTAALWYIANMMKYPGANTLVVRKVYKDHKDSTYAQLNWAIRDLGVEHLWDSRLSPLEIQYKPTGQKILFRGLDDPMSITSITVPVGFLCWCWFEEAYQIASENDFNMVDGSIRGLLPEPLWKQITGTMNPWNEKHWIKKRFFDTADPNVFTLKTTYQCNEFIDKADIAFFEDMQARNPRRYNVEGLGNWGVAEGLVFDNWTERDFVVNELVKARPHIQSGFGLDFGFKADPSAFIAFLVDMGKKEIFIFDEHYQKGMLNNEVADMIKYKGYAKERIVADSAEPKSIEEIKRHGILRIKPARKGRDSVSNGIQFLQQFRMFVHPKCTNVILELNNYAYSMKDGKVTNEPIDEYNHLLDAMRYAAEQFLQPVNIRVLSGRTTNA